MWKRWWKKTTPAPDREEQAFDPSQPWIELKGRKIRRKVNTAVGASILELAERHGVDWNSNCRRGTCARCRCLVIEGREFLTAPNDAETARLTEEEIDQGYRLGCQAKVEHSGNIVVEHASYFI